MPVFRFRTRLLDHLVRSASGAGELGLALLMTAGVVHCGGKSETTTGEGAPDAAADHQIVVEGAIEAAVFPDAGFDASPSPWVEAPISPYDAGSDAHPAPLPEAPPPPVVEAATPIPEAGSDAHPSPWVEAR